MFHFIKYPDADVQVLVWVMSVSVQRWVREGWGLGWRWGVHRYEANGFEGVDFSLPFPAVTNARTQQILKRKKRVFWKVFEWMRWVTSFVLRLVTLWWRFHDVLVNCWSEGLKLFSNSKWVRWPFRPSRTRTRGRASQVQKIPNRGWKNDSNSCDRFKPVFDNATY